MTGSSEGGESSAPSHHPSGSVPSVAMTPRTSPSTSSETPGGSPMELGAPGTLTPDLDDLAEEGLDPLHSTTTSFLSKVEFPGLPAPKGDDQIMNKRGPSSPMKNQVTSKVLKKDQGQSRTSKQGGKDTR